MADRLLWTADVGPRMWNLPAKAPTPFSVYMASPRKMLRGEGSSSPFCEVGMLIDAVFFMDVGDRPILGVMSPLIIDDANAGPPSYPLLTLREIISRHPSVGWAHSYVKAGEIDNGIGLLGLGEYLNYRHGIALMRTITDYVTAQRWAFLTPSNTESTKETFELEVRAARAALDNTSLPYDPPAEPFRRWLGQQRVAELYREIDALNATEKSGWDNLKKEPAT